MQRTLCVSSICSRLYDASTSGIVCQEFSCPMWGFACSHDSSCSSCAFPGAKEMDIVFVCEQHPSGGKARGCCTCQDACCKQALQLSGSKVFHHDNECFMYREETPATLDFKVMEGSMYNTPPCWAIYMCGLVFNHMLRNGGIEAMQKTNDAKAKLLYDAIDGSDGFYVNPIALANRSNMNVPFTIPRSQELEAVFIKEATAAGMVSTFFILPSSGLMLLKVPCPALSQPGQQGLAACQFSRRLKCLLPPRQLQPMSLPLLNQQWLQSMLHPCVL